MNLFEEVRDNVLPGYASGIAIGIMASMEHPEWAAKYLHDTKELAVLGFPLLKIALDTMVEGLPAEMTYESN